MLASTAVYRRKDAFYTRAKLVGYRSRAAFKLEQLVRGHRLLSPGNRIIDLGAWPGGWLQVAARYVGPTGQVVGVDLRPVDPLPEVNVITIVGDIGDPHTRQQVMDVCKGRADVILSDIAPKLTGVRARDEACSFALAESVLHFAGSTLRTDGKLIVKLFMSNDLPRYLAQLRTLFRQVRTTRPEATRKASAEIYAIACGFHDTAD